MSLDTSFHLVANCSRPEPAASLMRCGNLWWIIVNTIRENLWQRQHSRTKDAQSNKSRSAATHVSLESPGPPQRLHQSKYRFKKVADQLQALAKLAPQHCYGKSRGVHSVLRGGRRATELCPHRLASGALPLLRSNVERKTKSTQTTHTTRSQSHWVT